MMLPSACQDSINLSVLKFDYQDQPLYRAAHSRAQPHGMVEKVPASMLSFAKMATVTFDRITVDPAQCDGQPCVRGLRIPVHLILKLLANGKTPAEVTAIYPELELADIQQSMKYAAWLASEKTVILTGSLK